MRFKFFRKNNGFSLMEVLLAAAIVAILAIITIPVINRQISKTDEYAYYMAYKTVEKMAGQIAAAGDPSEIPATTSFNNRNGIKFAKSKQNNSFIAYLNNKIKSNPVNKFATKLGEKFANTQAYILSKFVPKSYADDESRTLTYNYQDGSTFEWSSEIFDDLVTEFRVCILEESVVMSTTAITTTNSETGESTTETTNNFYSKEDYKCEDSDEYLFAYNVSSGLQLPDSVFDFDSEGKLLEINNSGNDAKLYEMFKKQASKSRPNAQAFCLGYNGSSPTNDYGTYTYATIMTNGVGAAYTDAVSNTLFLSPNDFFALNYDSTKSIDGKYGYIAFTPSADEDEDEEGKVDGDSCDGLTGEDYNACKNAQNAENIEDDDTTENTSLNSERNGSCKFAKYYQKTITIGGGDIFENSEKEPIPEDYCDTLGYKNMINASAPDSISCICKINHSLSVNDSFVCVPKCSAGTGLPYATFDNNNTYTGSVCCKNDFNKTTNTCCPDYSQYNATTGECECNSGYMKNSSGTRCELDRCPQGYFKSSDNVCVLYPPVIKANRFCDGVKSNFNTISVDCDRAANFTVTDGFAVNQAVYNAAIGNSGKYLSVDSKLGAFNSIDPNIVLSNGLKLWVLGDKSASIPGISYYGDTIAQTQNMCKKIDLGSTNTKVACDAAGGYFCGADNICISVSEDSTQLGDGRNCCGTVDFSSIQAAAQASGGTWEKDSRAYAIPGFTVFVDINGSRGSSTLWEDIYPFYISSNGTVYPGYPLDGDKAIDAANSSLYVGGNSEVQLPTDVYYYLPIEGGREKKVAFAGVSYARAVCSARLVSKYTPYCLNLGEKFAGGDPLPDKELESDGTTVKIDRSSSPDLVGRTDLTKKSYIEVDDEKSKNPCDKYRCFVAVRKKLKSF